MFDDTGPRALPDPPAHRHRYRCEECGRAVGDGVKFVALALTWVLMGSVSLVIIALCAWAVRGAWGLVF